MRVNRLSKLIIIDGNSIAYRAFYALPLLSNSSGLHTNAVYGFTTMLLKLIEEEQPTHFLVAFDAGKETFRHESYKEYKGGRAKTPPELSEQFPLLKELLGAMNIALYEQPGYEADDIIGTLSRKAGSEGQSVLIVSGDKDMLQLASVQVTVALTRKGISEVDRYDPQEINEKYGLRPEQIIDLKGLMGDTSDNIPGIPGVGEKTALKLLHEYGSVEEVLAHTHEMKGKMKERIETHAEDARMSKDLATIFCDVPLELEWNELVYQGYDGQNLLEMFRKLEFKSLIEKMDFGSGLGGTNAQDGNEQEGDTIEITVLSAADVATFVAQLDSPQALHVEVVGDNPHYAEIIGVSFYQQEKGTYVPIDLLRSEQGQPLAAWFADSKHKKYLYDAHRAEVAFAWSEMELKGIEFDILLAAYLLDPTESALSFGGLASKFSLSKVAEDHDVFGKGSKFKIPELEVLSTHLCHKARLIHQIVPHLEQELADKQMKELYYELELPLSSVLAGMELRGIKVNKQALKDLGTEFQQKIDKLVKEIYDMAGVEFNINSPKQMGEILFDKLGLPVIKKTKTGYSTDAEVLDKLAPYHDIVKQILDYRQLAKLQSTYVEGLLKEVNEQTGKVHTYYKQTIAATGRLSSQYPNLQNIPIRLEEGRKIRKVFVPAEPGWHILSADYSQIELRVLAHISEDEKLMEAFCNNLDIHTKTAMDIFNVSEEAVDANMRRQAKAVNFGIVYGISDYGLSQNLHITRKEAKEFIDQYFEVFRGVRQYMDEIIAQARTYGYVTTLLHRRRYLPEITASNFNLRSFAERTAMNTPIQGSAADIIKQAMVSMAERIKEQNLQSRMLLQVHDELVFETPEHELEVMSELVRDVMESAIQLKVPLKVDISEGLNWYEAK